MILRPRRISRKSNVSLPPGKQPRGFVFLAVQHLASGSRQRLKCLRKRSCWGPNVCSWEILFPNSGSGRQVLRDHSLPGHCSLRGRCDGLLMMALGDGLHCSTPELLRGADVSRIKFLRCKAPFRRWILYDTREFRGRWMRSRPPHEGSQLLTSTRSAWNVRVSRQVYFKKAAQHDDARHIRPSKFSTLLVLDPVSTSAARCRAGSEGIA